MSVAAEGAVDHVLGRPRDQPRYHPHYNADRHQAWMCGWDSAQALIEERGQKEATRWLSEAS